MQDIPDYSRYRLDTLYDMLSHLDKEQCPERVEAIVDHIKRLEAEKSPHQDEAKSNKRLRYALLSEEIRQDLARDSFSNLKRVPWTVKNIVLGMGIPILFLAISHALFSLDLLLYRPWIANPLFSALWILLFLSLLLFPLYIFRKSGLWPLLHSIPPSRLLKEFLVSLFIVFLIGFAVGLIMKLLSIPLKTEIVVPESWRWATYAPNSILLIAFLILGFTFAPAVEEIFFRGFLYNALRTRLPVVIAAILQAAFFAMLHRYDLLHSSAIFLIGIALVVVYEKRKNLLAPMFVHGIMNAMCLVPLLVLALQNFHIPAANWEVAKTQPPWLKSIPPEQIERKENGIYQWQYAIDTWGSRGSRQWRKEVNAFSAVCKWFPEDRIACAKAQLGIVAVYHHYLRDYRRAIVQADMLLTRYPDQKEQCALALSKKGWSYYMLKDFQKSRDVFNRVLHDYKNFKEALEIAQKGIEILNVLQKN